jgi:SAM-dependent methyltransferase
MDLCSPTMSLAAAARVRALDVISTIRRPPSPQMSQLLAALRGNQGDADQFIGVIAGTVPIPDFFAPGNIQRILDTRGKPAAHGHQAEGSSMSPPLPATGADPGPAPGQDPNVIYALGSSPGESARLQRQAEELAADSRDLLDRVGLRPGQAVIDLGCGPRGILDMLASRVAPAGRVVGLDADPAHTVMAAEFAAGRVLRGVEIITADARRTGLPSGSFDLVHARMLLVNLPDPADVAAEMVRLARPGGRVASMEPDTEHSRCHPPHPAFDRLCDIFTVAFRRNGADPWIGRRVPELLRQAGLEDIQVEARVQMYPPGNSRRTVRPDLVRAMRPQVLEMGLASAAELDELDTAARAHLEDPHTVVISGLLLLTWGRKPDRRRP